MTLKCSATFLVLYSAVSFAAQLLPEMGRCDRKQAEFDDCIREALQGAVILARDSIPQLGLPRIEPLYVAAMTISAGTGIISILHHYKNVAVSGFTDVKVQHLEFDFKSKKIKMSAFFNKIQMKADYELKGRVLLLPINGNGPSTFTMEKVEGGLNLDFEIIEKRGKNYFNITGNQLSLKPSLVTYNFVNLFNGDKVLGDNINKVLNENWKEVFEDAKEGYEKAFGAIFQSLSEAVFSRVPIREIFLNETEL